MRTNRRRGISLIEMTAVFAVSTLIAGMAVWLVHASMQKSRDGQKRLAMHNTMARLADTFRGDAHAAVAIAAETSEKKGDGAASTWLVQLASGGAVRYRLQTGRLLRYEFDALPTKDKLKDPPKPSSQDSFELPAGCTVSIELQPTSQPRIATLFITPFQEGAEARAASRGPLVHRQRIDAAVSTDARFGEITLQTEKKPTAKESDR